MKNYRKTLTSSILRLVTAIMAASSCVGYSFAQDGTTTIISNLVSDAIGIGEYHPEYPTNILYVDSEYQLVPSRNEDYATIIVIRKGNPIPKELELADSHMQQIESIRRVGENAIVVGRSSASSFGVALISLETSQIADSFLANSVSVSPNGQYIALSRFFPDHDGRETQSNCYAIYSVAAGAAGNRPLRATMPEYAFEPERDVGAEIFPFRGDMQPDMSCTTPGPEEGHIMMSSGFKWSSDSQSVYFVDRLGTQVNVVMARKLVAGGYETLDYDMNGHDQICTASTCDERRIDIVTVDGSSIEMQLFAFDGAASKVVDISRSLLSVVK